MQAGLLACALLAVPTRPAFALRAHHCLPPAPTRRADVVYSAMRKLALQRQQDSVDAAAAEAPAVDAAEVVDGEEAEGATGERGCQRRGAWHRRGGWHPARVPCLLGAHLAPLPGLPAELIVVKIPTDFTIPESCSELVEQVGWLGRVARRAGLRMRASPTHGAANRSSSGRAPIALA